MYSILPALVAVLFLFYGFYVVHSKGLNRITTAFLILCVTTFFWQFAWAVLFQIEDQEFASGIIKIGWLLILFLPTSLYQFLTEVTGRYKDLKFVYASYIFSGILAVALITTNGLIDGAYDFFFGYYPKAGLLHPLHVLQTCLVVSRGLYITYKKQQVAQAGEKTKLQYCITSLFIYFFAAVDYLCNYGVEFYPPGVIFIAISLGIMALATTRYQVMDNSRMIASSIAHEMRTPLATLGAQSQILAEYLPELVENYKKTTSPENRNIPENILSELTGVTKSMKVETRSINDGIDHLLAVTSYEYLDKSDFHEFSVKNCVEEAVIRTNSKQTMLYTSKVHVYGDFMVYASREFLTFVLINLIKNAYDSIQKNGSGHVNIYIYSDKDSNRIEVTDTGTGIDKEVLPHIFDKFFTTKRRGKNSGIGLAFCRSVMTAFGGSITCQSVVGSHTTFQLFFKNPTQNKVSAAY